MLVEEGVEARNVNGILGLLCREHFPGLVWVSEDDDPEIPSFDTYALVPDAVHRNLVDRVIQELWDFFRCQPGKEERAYQVAYASCKRRVADLYYDSHIQVHIDYNATFCNRRISRPQARQDTEILTREQYLQVIPNWCATHPDCWATIVDRWLDADWQKLHQEKSQ